VSTEEINLTGNMATARGGSQEEEEDKKKEKEKRRRLLWSCGTPTVTKCLRFAS
jgi:hypothetical protein